VTPLAYGKIGAALALIAACLSAGYHFGRLSADNQLNAYKSAVEAQHVVQLNAVVATMTEHDTEALAQHTADQRIVDAYDLQKTLPPVTAGFVTRLRVVETTACSAGARVVSGAGPVASGIDSSSAISRSDAEGDRLLQAALDAADRDAEQLNAVIHLAPHAQAP
jgi:hypothetical protein